MIIYIGFSSTTNKPLARIVCRNLKHCAPIVVTKNKYEIYQFTKPTKITIIPIKKRDIKILKQFGWIFIKHDIKHVPKNALKIKSMTCVRFTKKFCGIKKWTIQTPDSLLKYLSSK